MSIYCTYVTFYSGNKLPPFYIGSTTVEKINNGYHGSVSSRRWKSIYESELKNNNPQLFITEIIETFDDRQKSLEAELSLQIQNNVMKSDMFFNESMAAPSGFFGRNVMGENNPRYGCQMSQETKNKISMTKKLNGSQLGENNPFFGKRHAEETKSKISANKSGVSYSRYCCVTCHLEIGVNNSSKHICKIKETWECPHCESKSGQGVKRYNHFENCKRNPENILPKRAYRKKS